MHFKSALAWVAVSLLLSPPCSLAQDAGTQAKAKGDPYAFSIRVYRLPADELIGGFVSKERGRLRAPALPPASASHGELEAFLKRSHEVIKEYLALKGLTLPPGSLACYDPESETLALRAMAVVHTLVEPWAESLVREMPKHLTWMVEIVEAAPAEVRAAMKDVTGAADQVRAYDRLVAQGKVVSTMRGETKSGQRVTAKQGPTMDEVTNFVLREDQRLEYAVESKELGTEVEIDPVVSADGAGIDINVRIAHHPTGPTVRWDPVTGGSASKVEARVLETPFAVTQTAITLGKDHTKLLGVWKAGRDPDGSDAPEARMQAAFLRMAIVPLLPLVDPRAEQILKERGEAVVPTPKGVRPVPDATLPPGMQVRRFRVPPDYLSGSGSGAAAAAPADPFAGGAPANEPRFMRPVTAEDILRAQGIPFPEGASANFLAETAELVVRNLPANLELVAEYIDNLNRQRPKTLAVSVHVVQAEAALVRRLEKESFGLPDHKQAWATIEEAAAQGQAKVLRSLWLETKGGQRATSEDIVEYASITGLQSEPANPAAEAKDGKRPAGALEVQQEMTQVGLHVEVDPVMGADGRTIDLNLALSYHYAPPAIHPANDAGPEATQRLAAPVTEFRSASFQTSTTLRSGWTRMISVWKPAGAQNAGQDVLQAAFIRADVIEVNPPAK